MRGRRRVLFVAEAVTLAQVARLAVLARALDPARCEIHFASSRFDELVFAGTDFECWRLRSLSPDAVARTLAAGRRVYTERVLERYIEDDLRLLRHLRPDLVVGDLRLSLSVAAPLAGVPHAALCNAYWSPRAVRDGFPVPDHPLVRLLGVERAARYFPLALPHVFDHFALPVNALRRRHGLPPIGSLPEVLTYGDDTLFADAPEVAPVGRLLARERFLGPVCWSAPVALPEWWTALDPARPTAYVTLGSSGRADLLPRVLEALASAGVQSLVSTAGAAPPRALPAHAHAAAFLPGDVAIRRADVVVSNGGSSTGYQAVAGGRPVVGIPFSMDQYLSAHAIERAGAGLVVRAGTLRAPDLVAAVHEAISNERYAAAARSLARAFAGWPAPVLFRDFVAERLDRGTAATLGRSAPA